MTHLTFLARFIFRQISHLRAHLFIAFTVIVLVLVQPLFVSANPIPPIGSIHDKSQVAKVAQSTSAPQEEPTEKPTQEPTEKPSEEPTEKPTEEPSEEPTEAPSEEPTEEPSEEPTEAPSEEPTEEPSEEPTGEPTQEPLEEASVEATQVVEEPTTTPVAEQSSPVGAAATAIISVEVPAASTLTGIISYTLPTEWQGTEAIPAEELSTVAPPLQAEVIQGQFQVAYVSSPSKAAGEAVLRILPLPTATELGSLRLGLRLDASSTTIPFPAGQTLVAQLTARVYAPDATTRLVIADDEGSSSVAISGLNWNDYKVARRIDAGATSLEVVVEWRNVPSNAWLEVRGFKLIPAPAQADVEISPTDTPTTGETTSETNGEGVAIAPTTPLTSTPKAPAAIATLPTATPVPETVSGTAAISATVPFIIVTSTPTAADVYEEATRVAQATDWARILGPSTPTPPNLATPTPTITPIVVTNTPAPANAATATQMAILATAIAFTTGTPTPMPANALIVVATAPPVKPGPTARPTATATPIFILLDSIPVANATATPGVPAVLADKIVFLSSYRGNPRAPNAMVINPDGSGVGLLTTNYFYSVLAASDSYSADSRFHAYSLREAGGAAHNAGPIQIFYTDSLYDFTPHQLTYFGDGVAWAPSWSPTSQTVAYVSNETGNDEIFVSQINQWPGTQLTKNDWEWDHHPSFSPNGSEIVFDSNRVGGRRQLWIMSASGENQRQLTNFTFEAWDPVWVKFVAPEVVSASDSTSDSTIDP